MGIRTVCPNGHRLHLKAQLAGRRGLCPDCGARFRIPTESSDEPQPFAEPPSRRAKNPLKDLELDLATESQVSTVEVPAAEIPMALPVDRPGVHPAARASAGPASSVGSAESTFEAADALLGTPASPGSVPMGAIGPAVGPAVSPAIGPPMGTDLLNEVPDASWFVQPPTGGRYGPAKAETIRQWIGEGRINDACLIWRDGWSEWQSASTILGSGAVSNPSIGSDVLPSGSTNLRHRRKGSKGLGVSMIVVLALACLLLLGILFAFINSGKITL